MSMAPPRDNGEDEAPHLRFTSPTFGPSGGASGSGISNPTEDGSRLHRRRFSRSSHHRERHVRLQAPEGPKSSGSSIYMGSYARSPRSRSRISMRTPASSAPATPRGSISTTQLENLEVLLQDRNLDLETYGVEELRDGFFDALFFKPPKVDREDLMRDAEETLPAAFKKKHPLSPKNFLPKQWHEIQSVFWAVTTSRAGVKLSKSFLAFFIAYILCLVPAIRHWLGRYYYIMVLSTILNHPGRTVGAQIDGAFLTIMGTATGLGWGAFALWLSTATTPARKGYGGVLAAFLVIFMGTIAALRSYYIRLYQLIICAGIAVIYTCLADTSMMIDWGKLFSYGIPWLFGQAICMLICCTIFPDAGARPLAVALHDAFAVMQEGLIIPQSDDTTIHRRLAWTFVNLSQALRDLTLDVSVTRFHPSDVMSLRNLMQGVIRSLLSLRMEKQLFDDFEKLQENGHHGSQSRSSNGLCPSPLVNASSPGASDDSPVGSQEGEVVIEMDNFPKRPQASRTESGDRAVKLVVNRMADPTSALLSCMKSALAICDAVLMDMSGYRKYLGPPKTVSSDVLEFLTTIRKTMVKYDEEEESLLNHPDLPPTYSDHPEVVELFLFAHPIRLAATSVEALLVKVMEMQQRERAWRIYLPSYPWAKALNRTNAQVRHDRGGVTAGFYFRSQTQLAKTMRGMANIYKPLPRQHDDTHSKEDTSKHDDPDPMGGITRADTLGKYDEEEDDAMNPNSKATARKKLRYRLWLVIHRLQGFETRFAFKVVIVTSLLAVPAWLSQSRGWWNANESWWAVAMAWIMLHPRVGGNFQDLITRALCAALGALWGGLAYGARNGNPYVMAVFAAIYMLPMIYRFTQSSHPRSGIVGCISFVVVSLGAKTADPTHSVAQIAWTRGVAFAVGVVGAVIVNWVLWPFVARHELRKALSAMMIYSSIIYRGVVAKYVYYEQGEEPGKEDIERSEMLEGRLREGFVRIRQLMALTRHEIRLRGPFNPLPYSALISACEHFFEYLVAVRQSSLFFHPHYMSDNEQAAESLLAYRRDAVASILMNLYVLAGALRGNRKVPRYLPSAAAARKRLLEHMAEIEAEQAANMDPDRVPSEGEDRRKWSQIYSYSYSQSLTGCVKQLEELIKYTKEIVGEQGFDPIEIMDFGDVERETERSRGDGVLDGNDSPSHASPT